MKDTNSNKLIKANSDTGLLKQVLMHRPDTGIERVTPDNAVDLLYEDIVYLPKMCKEHDWFTMAISCFIGKENILEVSQILQELLKNAEIKKQVIEEIAIFENLSPSIIQQLNQYQAAQLAEILISGIDPIKKETFFKPLPNFIFTRDIGVVINQHILIAKAA